MRPQGRKTLARPWLWLLRLIGVIVPRRLRADWRQEWEAELQYRETLLARWDNLRTCVTARDSCRRIPASV
jgi:hypothetical protein